MSKIKNKIIKIIQHYFILITNVLNDLLNRIHLEHY